MRNLPLKRCLSFIIVTLLASPLFAQYTVNGFAAQITCNEYRLTQNFGQQNGSVWNNIKINLTQSFDFNFNVILSTPGVPNDGGADGIAFVMQPISTIVGSSGGGLGYEGISPAVGVTIDTYQNAGDPTYDHIAIQLNGDIGHSSANNIAGPVTALSGNDNIEDGIWHSLRIVWDAPTKTLTAYMDGVLRVTVVKDFVTDVFGGNPLVYWGFTGSTGGLSNYQGFKTALSPAYTFSTSQKRCINEPITFNNTTVSFSTIAKFYWDFGDGSPLDSVNYSPTHTYATGGTFTVKQRVVGADGCEATNTQDIFIGSKPIAAFTNNGNCIFYPSNFPLVFSDASTTQFGTVQYYYWDMGNGQTSVGATAQPTYPTPGDKLIKHVVTSVEGCESDTLFKTVHMYGEPLANFTFTDSVCLGQPTLFFGNLTPAVGDTATLNWSWNYNGNVQDLNVLNPAHTFTVPGIQSVLLVARPAYVFGSGACLGIATKAVFVVNKPTAYFKFNTICQGTITTFTDSSYTSDGTPVNQWWWGLGNSGTSILQNSSGIYPIPGNDTIKLVVHNSKGCASDTLKQPVVINNKPIANFGYSTPVCNGLPVSFSDSSKTTTGAISKWSWVYAGTEFSTQQNTTHIFTPGLQTVKLVATNSLGCVSDTAFKTFLVNPSPSVSINFKDACKNALVDFTAVDNSATVTQWKWVFGDGGTALTQNAQHAYSANGTYKVKLYATAANGCYSDSLTKDIVIYSTNVFAGNDTIAAAGQPVQLNATGGLSYSWTPATPLNNPNIANPVAILNATQTFTVRAFTPEGCESFDDVTVNIYKGPDIYLPTAFTPNGDGRNDLFRGIPVGIKQFNYLRVFNRWGQLIFATSDYNRGWDGSWQGQQQPAGVYVITANGIDFRGNEIDKRQTVMLIR
ncbi:PKD domain-containing protein [Ferruginibacter sp. SUN106]|uniref:PKD domain-containing protein n=1 Tax=Ferruginibacter sp. SUN106 TaxID=2978348 RepID=UPI003D362E61